MVDVIITKEMTDDKRRTLVYNGAILVFRHVPAIVALCERVKSIVREAMQLDDPQLAHHRYDREQFAEIAGKIQLRYATDSQTLRLWTEGLRQAGVDPNTNCLEGLALRIQPPGTSHLSEETIGLGPHRDVWYGCPVQQHNWWGPIFPIDAQSCLAIYPRYWARAIENSSSAYSMEEFSRSRAEARANGLTIEQMEQRCRRPLPTEPLDERDAVKLLIEPGDLLCFSSAQLHFGIPNTSPLIRFSTEIRTVHLGDIERAVGASCTDSYGSGSSMMHFSRIADGRSITELLSAATIAKATAQACPNAKHSGPSVASDSQPSGIRIAFRLGDP
jgi:hypothetical protein